MDALQHFDGLEFYNQFVFYNNIHSISAIEPHFLVADWQGNLSLERNACNTQFVAKTFLISRLQQAWAKFTVNLNSQTNNATGERVFLASAI